MVQYFWLHQQLILRIVGSAALSFAVVLIFMPRLIRMLIRLKLGDRPEFDHAQLNDITRHKSNTPTMGGLLIAMAIMIGVLMFADLGSFYIRMSLVCLVWLACLGAADDWLKLRAKPGGSRDGLKMWEKILFQIGLAMLLSFFIYSHGSDSTYLDYNDTPINAVRHFYLPFRATPLLMGPLAFYLFTIITMVGSSNAVNLTDGMDGLASGCMIVTAGLFLMLAWVAGNQEWANLLRLPFVPEAAELTVVCASMIGACLGFLWYNCSPAQVFMGDTGSLPLGGLLGFVSVVTRQELMLFIAGGVFVMEAMSVIIQIVYSKSTGGKRVFLCAPIHHHFHLFGWTEQKVVVRFWILSVIFAAVAMATLKLR